MPAVLSLSSPAPRESEARPESPAKGFWPSFVDALTIAFRGPGAAWIPLLAAVLVGGILLPGGLGGIARFAFVGLLGNYFAASIAIGMEGDRRAPKLFALNNLRSELVLPGMVLILLAIVLWGVPALFAFKIGMGVAERASVELEADMEQLQKKYASEQGKFAQLDYDEPFVNGEGKTVRFSENDKAQVAKRIGGGYVKVYPRRGFIIVMPDTFKPSSYQIEEPRGYDDEDEDEDWEPEGDEEYASMAGSDSSPSDGVDPVAAFTKAWKGIPTGQILLLALSILFAFYYWPISIAVACVGGSLWAAFNPLAVLPVAARGGREYAAIAGLGIFLLVAPFFIFLKLGGVAGLGALFAFFLGGLGYCACVQGFLIGRLFAERPEVFPEANA